MIALLRHGVLIGAALGAGLLALEILLAGAPLRGTAGAAGWMPVYVALGAACGAAAAPLAYLGAPRRARERAPGVLLAATAIALGWILLGWLPGLLAGSAKLPITLLVFGAAIAWHMLGAAAAGARPAWLFASFAAPPTALAALLLLSAAALLAHRTLPREETPGLLAPLPVADDALHLAVVVLEGVRADRLGCYGAYRATTPRLDELAQESVLFEQAFAASSEHAEALAGLLGGDRLARGLAERGFRTWAGGDGADLEQLAAFATREDAGRPRLETRLLAARLLGSARATETPPAAGGEALVARALAWIRGGPPDRPFGLILHLAGPGAPYDPPPALRERFRPDDLDPEAFARASRSQAAAAAAGVGDARASATEARALAALHDAELLAADGHLHDFVAGLREAGLLERTLLIIVSDHGVRFGEEGGRLGSSGSAHDAVLRVPLLARLPSRLPAATRARGLISLESLADGVLDLLDGGTRNDLARAAAGELPREAVSAQLRGAAGTLRVVRTVREKFVLDPAGRLLAYGDLLADPAERFLEEPLLIEDERRAELERRAAGLLLLGSARGGGGNGG